ncbi:MAG: ABC-F type ribosomal protection protein [Clostridia bacterium]|nr:ABC-F type ribosomal protection protein [Clostridia bacterium]
MSMIQVSNLTFIYDGSYEPVFENVSFHIDSNWKLGFTGRNGRGKTTFLKLLMGQYVYQGTISSNLSFEYFPYEVDQNANTLAVIQNKAPDAQEWEIERELSLLKVDIGVLERPFYTLSNGERTKVLLAALFLKENAFLLIDEPTNHLDSAGRQILARYLNRHSGFILVSHDRLFLDECIDHILVINKKNIDIYKGNFSTWQYEKQMQDERELAENEKHKKEIHRLKDAATRTAKWSEKAEQTKHGTRVGGLRPDRGYIGHKAEKMMQRSKNIERRREEHIEQKAALLHNIDTAEDLKLSPLPYFTDRIAEVCNLSAGYDGTMVCRNISFDIRRGDRIALQGGNGTGKSTLLKIFCGLKKDFEGQLIKSDRLIISYVPQSTDGLSGDLKDYARHYNIDESLFKSILRKLDFSRTQFEKDISDFSDGQKKKVLIARSLCEQAHLYVWDEPLNYIDVLSRMQIERLILAYKPTILFVEHDMAFCENIATKTIKL